MSHKARVLVFNEDVDKVGAGKTWAISKNNLTGPDVATGVDIYITSNAIPIHGWTKIKYKAHFKGNVKLESAHPQWPRDHWDKHKMSVQELDNLSTKFARKKFVAWSWSDTEELTDMWAKCSSPDKDTVLPHPPSQSTSHAATWHMIVRYFDYS